MSRSGSKIVWKDGIRYTHEGQVQRYLCRACGYRFSQSSVKVNVAGKVGKVSDSGENHHEVRVASGDVSDEKVYYGLPFLLGKNVSSHGLSIVERA